MTSTNAKVEDVLLLHGGDLSSDVAEQIKSKLSSIIASSHVHKISMSRSKEFKDVLIEDDTDDGLAKPTTLAIFIVQKTIENESPPEDAGACISSRGRRIPKRY